MTPEEKFLFDLNGYLVVKNALSPAEVAKLNATFEEKIPNKPKERYSCRISNWNQDYQNLMDHPRILPYLLEIVEPQFRLDHDYCIYMSQGDAPLHLHGGEGHEGDHWYRYRDGKMKNGLTVVVYALTDAPEGAGGFCCIPGTHKSNYLDGIPQEVIHFQSRPSYVVQPAIEAGDALIFTEALVHGTLPWQAKHDRRALLYKFSPGYSAWSQTYYRPDEYINLTERQKRILEPPCVGGRQEVDPRG